MLNFPSRSAMWPLYPLLTPHSLILPAMWPSCPLLTPHSLIFPLYVTLMSSAHPLLTHPSRYKWPSCPLLTSHSLILSAIWPSCPHLTLHSLSYPSRYMWPSCPLLTPHSLIILVLTLTHSLAQFTKMRSVACVHYTTFILLVLSMLAAAVLWWDTQGLVS